MFVAPLLLLLLLLAVAAGLVAVEGRLLREQDQRVTAMLRAHGLTLEGALQKTLVWRGEFEIKSAALAAVPALTLRNDTTVKLPGASGKSQNACVVQLDVPLPDLLICKVSEIDLLLGPLPSVRRTMTGDTAFDQAYAIFVQGEVEGLSGFRESGSGTSRLWSDSLVRAELIDLRAVWVRVREGRLEIALEPTAVQGAVRALRLAVGIHGAVRGHRAAEPPFAGLEIPPMTPPRLRQAVYVSCLASFQFTLFTFWPVASTSTLREMNQEALCGPGGTLEDSRHGVFCTNAFRDVAVSHYVATWLWCMSFYFLVVFMIQVALWAWAAIRANVPARPAASERTP